MQIHVPEDMGDTLKVFEEDVYDAAVKRLSIGTSKTSGEPKVTVAWVVNSEYSGKKGKNYESTVGNVVLDTYSLQPQAIWRLNDTYITLTGDRLPQGNYSKEEFEQILKDNMVGAEARIKTTEDDGRMRVEEVMPK